MCSMTIVTMATMPSLNSHYGSIPSCPYSLTTITGPVQVKRYTNTLATFPNIQFLFICTINNLVIIKTHTSEAKFTYTDHLCLPLTAWFTG